ncbi:MAG: right-handed parallel beta-helix repeat-containing protein [Nanoarchaeota archaeon]|nr:right-handed parallel beta-helix repeat-containing protein [Nanoarchaeota archaeon]
MIKKSIILLTLITGLLLSISLASATTTCTFTTSGTTMTLDSDCTTDSTIFIPDGMTLDGAGHTITAVDPVAGHFLGAIIKNAGSTASVHHLGVTASALANVCDGGNDRLRGIMLEGASGTIEHNTINAVNQGPSGCQEGNSIEVRNTPFDGTHPATVTVEVAHNVITDFMKTGIVANGDVLVNIHHNDIGASATQADLAANSIQVGFGGQGTVTQNHVAGNQWLGASDFSATAILLFDVDQVDVSKNIIGGNSDVGIYVFGDSCTIDNNKVSDNGVDGAHGDYGIFNDGTGNSITNNKVSGFDTPYENVIGGGNKVTPGPQKGNVFN